MNFFLQASVPAERDVWIQKIRRAILDLRRWTLEGQPSILGRSPSRSPKKAIEYFEEGKDSPRAFKRTSIILDMKGEADTSSKHFNGLGKESRFRSFDPSMRKLSCLPEAVWHRMPPFRLGLRRLTVYETEHVRFFMV
jgi:hypothetical protein